jgi:glutamate-1-semialdehyde 2,1-aminomutase
VTATGIDPARVSQLRQREERAFTEARPRSLALSGQARAVMPNGVPMSWMLTSYEHGPLFVADARGSRFTDVDGLSYADFNVADMSMFCGYGPEPVTAAVAARVAAGSQFLLPTEDAVWVAAELGRRYGLPQWQFTLSATAANTEAIRVARVRTGRDQVLLFDGKYHGHLDETLVRLADGKLVAEEAGLPADVTARTVVIPFNNPDALRAALASRRIALVLTEPALTNNIGLLLPDDGFHAELRAATTETGTLLAYDETHTQVVGPGGLTRRWGLRPDIVTTGKSIAGGVPLGAYGMTEDVAEVLARPGGHDDSKPLVATGGTLFGNPLSMAAARAAMSEVLTGDAYAHSQRLGAELADGLAAAIARVGLPWSVYRFWPRTGYVFAPVLPRTAAEAAVSFDPVLRHLFRVYLANRGVWEALVGAGPTCSVAADDGDVEAYLAAFGSLLAELTA